MKLTEEQIKEIIKEELGIASEVSKVSNEIYEQIIEDISKQTSEKTDICFITSGSITTALNNVKVFVNYTYRNFIDKNFLEDIDIDMLTDGSSVFKSQKFVLCIINLYGVSGTINKMEALNTIQHEVEHIYQEIKSNKRIPGNDNLYNKMRYDLEYGDINHKKVGKIFYLCLKSEQEAFINGTYAWCMCNDFKSPPYTYQEFIKSPVGKLYNELVELYDELVTNKEMINILQNDYHLSIEKIEKKIQKFLKRIGKVLIKVNNDKGKIWRK